MPTPLIYLAFANDQDRHLDLLKEESRNIFNTLEATERKGLVRILREESAEIDDISQTLIRHTEDLVMFHFAGHADGAHLDLEGGEGHAKGLAHLLAQQQALKLVFLNGCSTLGQVKGLVDAGVKAVIATSVSIQDRKAMEFATSFYSALVEGRTIEQAFELANGALSTRYGEELDIQFRDRIPMETKEETFPWGLYLHPEYREEVLSYRLPETLQDETPITKIEAAGDVHIGGTTIQTESKLSRGIRLLLFVLVPLLALSATYFWYQSQPLELTLMLRDEQGNEVPELLQQSATVMIQVGDRLVEERIGTNGKVYIPDILPENKGKTVQVELKAEIWEIVPMESPIIFLGEPIQLSIRREEQLGKIKGSIKTLVGRMPIEGAHIRINTDTSLISNEFGEFDALLPTSIRVTQKDATYKLTVSKKGFQVKEVYYSPYSPPIEIRLQK